MPEQTAGTTYILKENEAGIYNGVYFTPDMEPACEFKRSDNGLVLHVTIPLDSASFFPIDGNLEIKNPSNVITFETGKNIISGEPSGLFSAKPGGDIKLSISLSITGKKHTTG